MSASGSALLRSTDQAPVSRHGRTPKPARLHRTRKRFAVTPAGAVYVGKPTNWGNPFERRYRIGHARGVILYDAWLKGELTPYILRCGWFGDDEIEALARWRNRLVPRLIDLRGRDLQCWCPLTSAWCHANVLLHLCNGPLADLERLVV